MQYQQQPQWYAGETESNSNGEEKPTVKTVDNHVYFYSSVNADNCLALINALHSVDANLQCQSITRSMGAIQVDPVPIILHVQSYGGGVFEGLSVADHIRQLNAPVCAVIEGVCASAGTLIALPCHKRYITENSFVLIHQFSSFMYGTYEQFKDEIDLQDMLMDKFIAFYKQYSKLTEKKIRAALKRDTWFNPEKCLSNGLVDEVLYNHE